MFKILILLSYILFQNRLYFHHLSINFVNDVIYKTKVFTLVVLAHFIFLTFCLNRIKIKGTDFECTA